MTPFLLLALLPGGQDGAPSIVGQEHRAGIEGCKITRAELTTVEKRQRQTIYENRAQFLHQIERKTRTSRPVAMQEADRWIETNALGGATAIMGQHGIEKR